MRGILTAAVQEGPWKGWPLGAAMAVSGGATVEQVRRALITDIQAQIASLEESIQHIRALPAPDLVGEREAD